MKKWEDDKKWSDKFLHEIKGIIGQSLMSEPPVEEDRERNTDLVVLRMDAVRVACRIRRNEYLDRYSHEFTIRAGRPSGTKTELTKIIEGWGDYIFYGFADEDEESLAAWFLGDLNAFRLYHSKCLVRNKGILPGKYKNNTDNSSNFHAYDWAEIPGFIVSKHPGLASPLEEVVYEVV